MSNINTHRIRYVNTHCIVAPDKKSAMDMHERLQAARKAAGYKSKTAAAEALGMKPAAYTHHENDTRKFHAEAARYAKFFKVSLEWLVEGKGEMRPKRMANSIPMMGVVSAGSTVIPINDPAGDAVFDDIHLPEPGRIAGLKVKGDSMYPRFMDGEIILIDPTARQPASMVGHYAVVQTLDGRVMIKKLMRSTKNDHWKIWSHNAPDEDVQVLMVQRVLGVLT